MISLIPCSLAKCNSTVVDNSTHSTIHFHGIEIIPQWEVFLFGSLFYILFFIGELFTIIYMSYKHKNPRYIGAIVLNYITTILLLLFYISTLFNQGWGLSINGNSVLTLRWIIYPIIIFIRLYQYLFTYHAHKQRKQRISIIFLFSLSLIYMNIYFIQSLYIRGVWIAIGYILQGFTFIILFRDELNITKVICIVYLILYFHIYEIIFLFGMQNIAIVPFLYENISLLLFDMISSIIAILFVIVYKICDIITYNREREEDSDRIYESSSVSSITPLSQGRNRNLRGQISWYDARDS